MKLHFKLLNYIVLVISKVSTDLKKEEVFKVKSKYVEWYNDIVPKFILIFFIIS